MAKFALTDTLGLILCPAMESAQRKAPVFIGPKEVADLLSVSRRTVYRHRHDIEWPPAVTVGQMLRWRRADFLDWIDRQAAGIKEHR